MKRVLDENQPREQAGFRQGFSTTDHLQALSQLIEKSNEYQLPLCVGFIDYQKAFDSVEHHNLFQSLRKIGINEAYIVTEMQFWPWLCTVREAYLILYIREWEK